MKILHISAECAPAAKAGGLADVAGALPKYLNKLNTQNIVIIPKHNTKWINNQKWNSVDSFPIYLYHHRLQVNIEICTSSDLGFDLFCVNIPELYHRDDIYMTKYNQAYEDETQRHITFQKAVLNWCLGMDQKPDILHCHDHHTGLVPFLIKYADEYQQLSNIPTVFTIHNGLYHGIFSWKNIDLLPSFNWNFKGVLDWGNNINSLATAIKTCWHLTTVSPGYLEELKVNSYGLESLIQHEAPKSTGILNGIDNDYWNPSTDPFIHSNLKRSPSKYKALNKKALCELYNLDENLPLFTFIGRLVPEKGTEVLAYSIGSFLYQNPRANFIILGTGSKKIENIYNRLSEDFQNVTAILAFDEKLAHQLYAGSDFLLMPSFIEPCGLNQMYALRYGTVPIVSNIGGLKDSIVDVFESEKGTGIKIYDNNENSIREAIYKAAMLYADKEKFEQMIKYILTVDFSWTQSAKKYLNIYENLNRLRKS